MPTFTVKSATNQKLVSRKRTAVQNTLIPMCCKCSPKGSSELNDFTATKKKSKRDSDMIDNLMLITRSVKGDDLQNIQQVKAIRMKTPEEVEFLEKQFELDPTWNRKTVQYCKKTLNLRTDQVYKWGFDKKLLLAKKQKESRGKRGRKNKPTVNKLVKRDIKSCVDINLYVKQLVEEFEAERSLVPLNSL